MAESGAEGLVNRIDGFVVTLVQVTCSNSYTIHANRQKVSRALAALNSRGCGMCAVHEFAGDMIMFYTA